MNRKMTTAARLFRLFVTSGKQLALTALCGVLLSGALSAQESPAVQPPQPPQAKPTAPLTHLRQGQPGVYQSFQPCRLVDTRNPDAPFGGPKLAAGGSRSFSLVPSGGDCGDTLPTGATALAINVTITGTENGGYLTIWPTGQAQPNSSVINWTSTGTTLANAIIVPVGAGGSIDIFSSDATHVILDVSGYYLNTLETDDQLAIVATNETAALVGQNNGGGAGVRGESQSGPGVYGQSASGPAGYFAGPVEVAGNVTLSGAGNGIVFSDGTTQTTAGGGGGGGGVGGAGTANAVPLWTNGTTLGNSVITQSAAGVQLPNGVQLAVGAQGNQVAFGSPNSETGMTIAGVSGRADLRFNGTLKLVAGPAGQIPPATNGIAISTAGNVGIGTTSPTYKLDVVGPLRGVRNISNDMVVETTGGTNAWAKMWMITPSQRWSAGTSQNFNGNQFYLVDETFSQARMTIQPGGGAITFPLGNVGIGTTSPATKLHVIGTARTSVLEITGGSDLAEHFEVADGAKPGMVVAIDPRHTGRLAIARGAYNRRVAGIISGAKNLNAGMILPDLAGSEKSQPLALSGRVWVYVDATRGAIKPGDLLTTSATPGHAMRVANHSRAQGAIIGKAMTGLKAGRGLVLVLVTLQ